MAAPVRAARTFRQPLPLAERLPNIGLVYEANQHNSPVLAQPTAAQLALRRA